MTAKELIEEQRKKESVEAIIFIEDESMRNTLLAWAQMAPRMASVEIEVTDLGDLWEKAEINLEGVVEASGTNPKEGTKHLDRLISLRLIYPDGTTHRNAIKYVQASIAQRMSKYLGMKVKVE